MNAGLRFSFLICSLALLAGCVSVGPDYTRPELPTPDYSGVLQPESSGEPEGRGSIDVESLADWWDTLNDPILCELIRKALAGNHDLKEAEAGVREARYLLVISGARLLPELDASGNYEKSKSSRNAVFSRGENDLLHVGFDASWELDFFGGTRRGIEAAQADYEAREESRNAIWVSLAGEVAQSYIALRTLQKRLLVAETNLTNQQETYDILVSSFNAGLSNELPVQQARYNMERTRSTIPTIRSRLENVKNALAVLTGTMPGELHAFLAETKPIPVSSLKLVTGIPANTLRQRPDVRMAERQLAAQTARIGKAQSDLYPKFHLTGSIGLESLTAEDFFSANSAAWNFGPRITWPIFNAGSIRNNVKVQTARQEQYLARYEKTVIAAVKEVRDALVDYAEEQQRSSALNDATQAAQSAMAIAQDLYKNGLTDFNNVLDAQRSFLSLQDQLVVSEGDITTNLVRLYKALGGGWTAIRDNEGE